MLGATAEIDTLKRAQGLAHTNLASNTSVAVLAIWQSGTVARGGYTAACGCRITWQLRTGGGVQMQGVATQSQVPVNGALGSVRSALMQGTVVAPLPTLLHWRDTVLHLLQLMAAGSLQRASSACRRGKAGSGRVRVWAGEWVGT